LVGQRVRCNDSESRPVADGAHQPAGKRFIELAAFPLIVVSSFWSTDPAGL